MTKARKASGNNKKRREVKWLPIVKLRLDSHNPRLPDGYDNATQDQLLKVLALDYDLLDIGRSIVDNGYFSEEPLVTIPADDSQKWMVVEGNRRLAALLLLDDPEKAPPELVDSWKDIANRARSPIQEIPCLEYEKREQITPYLGYRHISGVLEWRPYQKGKYIAQLVEKSKRQFSEIARMIGSKTPTVREHYIAYTLVRQARNIFRIDTTRTEEHFGVLRRAMSDPNIRNHIGLNIDRSEKALKTPIPKRRSRETRELLGWLFGKDDGRPVIRESRQLKDFGTVLTKKLSVAILRRTGDLQLALDMVGGEERRFLALINKALYQLELAVPLAIPGKNVDEVRRTIAKCLDVLSAMDQRISKNGASRK